MLTSVELIGSLGIFVNAFKITHLNNLGLQGFLKKAIFLYIFNQDKPNKQFLHIFLLFKQSSQTNLYRPIVFLVHV